MTTAIERRPYGRTEEHVTVLGLGGGSLDKHSFADGVATVRRALELGVSYFDTSPLYGSGLSQGIYGVALQERSEEYLLATKLGFLASPTRYRSPDALRTQLDENLRLLRRDSVDTLQVHEAILHRWWSDDAANSAHIQPEYDYDFANAPIMQVLREAKAQGLCRFIGITGNSADRIARVLRHVEVDACLVAYNYSVLSRQARRTALPLARKKGVAFIAAGVIDSIGADKGESPDARLNDLQKASGLSLVALAIRYLIADPAITTILVGAATPAEIEESVVAAQAGALPPDLHQALEELETSPDPE